MRVLFVYPNISRTYHPQLGIASLAAVARAHGHEPALYDLTHVAAGRELAEFRSALRKHDPDLVAVSCRSSEAGMARRLLEEARRENRTTVAGGPHGTVSPDDLATAADFQIVGEGETAFAELLDALDSNGSFAEVSNLIWRRNGAPVKNSLAPLIQDLDSLPYPDWDLFDRSHFEQSFVRGAAPNTHVVGAFEGSRGCPYRCTYCTNEFSQRLYAGKGRWRREKSPARMTAEVADFRSRFGLDLIYWVDEVFLTRVERLRELSRLFAERIGKPFIFMDRPELITEEKAQLAREAGAYSVSLGIETGDPDLRRQLLQRTYSDESVIDAFKTMSATGIKTHAFVMIGIPGENRDSILATYDILGRIQPDTAQFSVFYPLRGTRLYDHCVEHGYVDADLEMPLDYYSASVLRLPELSAARIGRYQRLFEVLGAHPSPWKRRLFVFFSDFPATYYLIFSPIRLWVRLNEARRRLGFRMFLKRLRVHLDRRLRRLTPGRA